MNKLDTSNSNNYSYTTKHLEIHILGGLKTNKLESLRITLSVQKPKQHNILRHSIDLYNDNQVEKFTRKIAERLEIGTSVVRRTLQELTHELENYRFYYSMNTSSRLLHPGKKNYQLPNCKPQKPF
ncbi:MAG: hypothetical protein ACWIPJ_06750 [Polaribacter sp.]